MMHNYLPKYFTFIDKFNKEFLEKLSKKVAIIYRDNSNKIDLKIIQKLNFFCKTSKRKLFIANNIKLAKILDCDGVYISAYNKKLLRYDIGRKKKFRVIGSAHSLDEILIKEKQGVDLIFLSPLFYNKKNNRSLGISKFNLLSYKSRIKIIALGGINNTNIKKLKMIKNFGFAAISFFRNKT